MGLGNLRVVELRVVELRCELRVPSCFVYSYWFRSLLHLRVYLQMFLYVGATRSSEWVRELKKKQIRWRAAIWLGCVCMKSKSHGTYGRKSSFHCVMSATFTYYSGRFVSLTQNSTTLAVFNMCWVESLATGQVIFKNLQAHGTFQSPRFLTESIRVRRSNAFFTHITLTLTVELKTVKDLNSFNS